MDEIDKKIMVINICKFLKKHQALEKYCTNVLSYHYRELRVPNGLSLRERVKYIVTQMVNKVNDGYPDIYDFFQSNDTCFCWAYTPEGGSFWSNLHDEWCSVVTVEDY